MPLSRPSRNRQLLLRAAPFVAAAAAVIAVSACSKPIDPAIKAVMHERHEGFEAIGDHFKKVADTLKAGGGLDAETGEAARAISAASTKLVDWFPAGSGPETGAKTDAKAAIWENPDDFTAKREDFVTAAAKWAQTVDANDASGFAAQFKDVGATCKACHETYREED